MPDTTAELPESITFMWSTASNNAWASHFLDNEPDLDAVVKREKIVKLIVTVPTAAILGGFFYWIIVKSQPDMRLFAVIAGCLISLPYMLYSLGTGAWNRFRKDILAAARAKPSQPISLTVRVNAEGFEWADDTSKTLLKWNSFEDIVRFENNISLVFADRFGAFVIPRSAFNNDAHADTWEQHVRTLHDASGHGIAARVRAALDSDNTPCGRCGHTLRGARDPICTECGTAITPARLKMWRTRRYPLWKWITGK